MTRIFVFGASIVYGAWDLSGGWVNRLKNYFHEKTLNNPNFRCLTYNLGVSGNTAKDLLERFKFEISQRVKKGEESIIIFSIGVNDSQIANKKPRYTPKEFKKNISELIKLAKSHSSKVIFTGLTPIDESIVDPIPWAPTKSYKNERIKMFNEIIKNECKNNNVHFIKLLNKLTKSNLIDGVHPNSEGHQRIYEAVKDFLFKNSFVKSI